METGLELKGFNDKIIVRDLFSYVLIVVQVGQNRIKDAENYNVCFGLHHREL